MSNDAQIDRLHFIANGVGIYGAPDKDLLMRRLKDVANMLQAELTSLRAERSEPVAWVDLDALTNDVRWAPGALLKLPDGAPLYAAPPLPEPTPEPEQPTAKVIPFTGITRLDLTPDRVLENLKGQLEGLVYAAYDAEGNEMFGSTYADGGTTLWLVERLKLKLLKGADE